MDYIDKIFERLDFQQIREFLMNGTECEEIDGRTYKQRLESASKPVFKMLNEKFTDSGENDEVESIMCDYVGVSQNVYMEISMKCGAILAMNLLTR